MLSNIWFKLKNGRQWEVTPTMEGTGSATAYYLLKKLVVTCAAAEAAKYVELPTPFGFKVVDVRIRHDDNTACSVQVLNTGQAISDDISIGASDTDIDRAAQIDDTSPSFLTGDDDLRLEVTTGAFTGVVEIIIEPDV